MPRTRVFIILAMRFTKLHGCGNAYVYVDSRTQSVADPPRMAAVVSDARTGVGSDGLFLLYASTAADVRAEMYNADGSRMAMCGNGIRCVGKLVTESRWPGVVELFPPQDPPSLARQLADGKSAPPEPLRGIMIRTVDALAPAGGQIAIHRLAAETDAGIKTLWCYERNGIVEIVTADIGPASLCLADMNCTLDGENALDREIEAGSRRYRVTCVSTGSLHAVVFVDDASRVDLEAEGTALERCPVFPDRANAHFVEVLSPAHLRMRIWERGSGATRGCGTGACAAVAAGLATGRCGSSCIVDQPGGRQFVDIGETIYLTGETRRVCDGDVEVEASSL